MQFDPRTDIGVNKYLSERVRQQSIKPPGTYSYRTFTRHFVTHLFTMWLLILAGLLAVSAGKETVIDAAGKTESSSGNADDIVMLEIDVKDPVKRSPLTANTDYAPSNQYILQSADGVQGLPPEYLAVAQQYAHAQPQAPPPQRRPQPPYSRQQQELQQAYYNFRKPTVVPPRPRAQLNPQAQAQAEVAAEIQAQIDAQNRADAIRLARLGTSAGPYDAPSYSQQKLGTFEQELLQLVSANQAQEFKLLPTQPKGSSSAYSQQLVSYPVQYAKPSAASSHLPEQYHIETSPPRYQQPQQAPAYQAVEAPVQYAVAQPAKAYNPSPQYDYVDENVQQKAFEAQAQAQAQAHAQAQALAFHKIVKEGYNKHHLYALQLAALTSDASDKLQGSALEQIQQGAQVSDAGRHHLQEQLQPKGAEAAYNAKVKAQAVVQTAEARKLKQLSEFKAHNEAIKKLEAQQQAHLRVQEELSNYNMNFEKNQKLAQAFALAQAEGLLKLQQGNNNKINKEIENIANAPRPPTDGALHRYDPAPGPGLPHPNDYFPYEQLQKLQASASSHVARSVPKPEEIESVEVVEAQPVITQPRQTHKLKFPPSSQAVYVSESGLLKKSPIKSLTIEETVESGQEGPVVQAAVAKGHALSEEDLSALINAGYTVTPVPPNAKSAQQIYAVENTPVGYYSKKQKAPVLRAEYGYEEVIQRPRKLIRKNASILKQSESADASEKVTFLVPLERSFGTRQPSLKHEK
ncbi:LOW QUALITY PROTEIN: uncharacterized protein LOC143180043 [Calliopsis andreniformis]|uniref:LOW QUALITY PROTEIN: uncharacterized protein LOC143180043 n=1 Tax=Calliopsis andreniformis TaxID=337506 RepID=UPI003FCC976F